MKELAICKQIRDSEGFEKVIVGNDLREIFQADLDLKQLRKLSIRDFLLSAETLEWLIGHVHCVDDLDLSSNQIDDSGAKQIVTRLPHLTDLNLSNNPIGNNGVFAIAENCFQLKSLNLSNTRIGEKSLAPISEISTLERLDISQNDLTQIDQLVFLNRLEALDISFTQVCDLSPLESLIGSDFVLSCIDCPVSPSEELIFFVVEDETREYFASHLGSKNLLASPSLISAGVDFDLFSTTYHQKLMGEKLEAAFASFCDELARSEIGAIVNSVSGWLRPKFNEDKFTGEESAVRDIFIYELRAMHEGGVLTASGEAAYDVKSCTFHSDDIASSLLRDDVKEIRDLRVKRRESLWREFLRQLRDEMNRHQLHDLLIEQDNSSCQGGQYYASLWHQTKAIKSIFSIEVLFDRHPKRDRWTVAVTSSAESPITKELFIESKLSAESAFDLFLRNEDSIWGNPLDS